MRVGIVVPHIFMHQDILPKVIFSPGQCALNLCVGLQQLGENVTLFSPGPVDTAVKNITADLSLFVSELAGRGDTYTDLLKKHPLTFVTLARQVQAELIAKAFRLANNDELDIVHIYTNEEELGMVFANLCQKPVVFTHHDPYNFLVRYKSIFPKYTNLPYISMSYAQRAGMPANTNWVANIYHGIGVNQYKPLQNPSGDYIAYMGRIIEPKGVHLAIEAVKLFNRINGANLKLHIAGKHYSGHAKDSYWHDRILPQIDNEQIFYDGFIDSKKAKNQFLGNAKAVIVPSLFEEPFGMVTIESLACGTPVIGLDSGAIPEIISDRKIGLVANKIYTDNGKVDESATAQNLASCLDKLDSFDRQTCREVFEQNFTIKRMSEEHLATYNRLIE